MSASDLRQYLHAVGHEFAKQYAKVSAEDRGIAVDEKREQSKALVVFPIVIHNAPGLRLDHLRGGVLMGNLPVRVESSGKGDFIPVLFNQRLNIVAGLYGTPLVNTDFDEILHQVLRLAAGVLRNKHPHLVNRIIDLFVVWLDELTMA